MKKRRPVLMKDIAAVAGTSVATVSLALSDSPEVSQSTKAKIRGICQREGYRARSRCPSRRQRAGTRRLGLLFFGMKEDDEILCALVHSFTDVGADRKVSFETRAQGMIEDESSALKNVQELASGNDGVMLCGHMSAQFLTRIAQCGIRCVLLGGYEIDAALPLHAGHPVPLVRTDGIAMGRLATEWLQRQGHTRIGFICSSFIEGMYAATWRDGYCLALCASGQPLDSRLFFAVGSEAGAGQRIADHFFTLDTPPTGYVISDSDMASAFLSEARARGCPIDPRAVVLSGTLARARRNGLETSCLITEDFAFIAQAAIDLFDQPEMPPREVLVPYAVHNLDLG